ncbi:MAG: hypothetical protein WA324_26940 [Bryobacteraceae bacterium]
MPLLVRDDSQPAGYSPYIGLLPRTKQESYVPWALNPERRVIYAKSDQYRNKPSKPGLVPYDSAISKQRRRLCQSALGSIALQKRSLWNEAVQKVSYGIKRFMIRKLWGDREGALTAFSANVAKYLYGTSYMSFGRVSDVPLTLPRDAQKAWDECIAILDAGQPLPTIMGLHDQVAIKMMATGDSEKGTYDSWANRFRASNDGELFNPNARGRADITPKPAPSTQAGIASATDGGGLPGVQLRRRGVDSYNRISFPTQNTKAPTTARPGLSGVEYYKDLDNRNELFGAGPSGTTGTLLASAMTFGKLDNEGARQYLLAIIGYLVGGGMHSLHESMTVVKFLPDDLRMEYNPGSMLRYEVVDGRMMAKTNDFPALPRTFLSSQEFAAWRFDYYDIVVMGGIHWMFNS